MIFAVQLFLVLTLSLISLTRPSPLLVPLKSELPPEPIEDPADWAWGLHPDNGLDYSAKESISLDTGGRPLTLTLFRTGSRWSWWQTIRRSVRLEHWLSSLTWPDIG